MAGGLSGQAVGCATIIALLPIERTPYIMLLVISPAKTLDFDTPPSIQLASQPGFLKESQQLIDTLSQYSPAELSTLMSLSDKLAVLNSTRYESWSPPFTPDNAKQAVLAFKGDVYTGLQTDDFSAGDAEFAQQHLRILSGLYGVLKPLDLIQPYRLEMGTRLDNARGKDLYEFWGTRLTDYINNALAEMNSDTLINLASNEYFKALKKGTLAARIITPVFKDLKNGKYKIISFFAKQARGSMARHIIKNRITQPEDIKAFNEAGYGFNAKLSDAHQWVFTRDQKQ